MGINGERSARLRRRKIQNGEYLHGEKEREIIVEDFHAYTHF